MFGKKNNKKSDSVIINSRFKKLKNDKTIEAKLNVKDLPLI